jgi:hypothetical protein
MTTMTHATMTHASERARRSGLRESGAVLIEFALVALVFYLLFAATVAFGRTVQASQVVQDAARLLARELSLRALPAATTFDEALVLTQDELFNPNWLVVDLEAVAAAGFGGDVDAFFDTLPLVNRALRPAMVFDRPTVDGVPRRLLRAPGALLGADPAFAPGHGFTVGVPIVVDRRGDGVERIAWRAVVEEIAAGSFALSPADPSATGLAAVRIQLPVQAAGLSGYREAPRQDPGAPPAPNGALVIDADDASVVADGVPPGVFLGGRLGGRGDSFSTYEGPFGLGRQAALGRSVRPFRRVVLGQALYRRELVE